MKKIFTLFTLVVLSLSATAQNDTDGSFHFIDEQGNVVPNGTVLNIKGINEEGKMEIPLKVKNMSGERLAVGMYEVIDNIPNGDWETCAFGNCMRLDATGYSARSIVASDYENAIQTEWIPEEGKYATWTATLQIHLFEIKQEVKFGQVLDVVGDEVTAQGPVITVQFEYSAESAGIGQIAGHHAAVDSYYNTDGRRLDAPPKGINILRMDDGRVIKQIK